MRPNFKQFGNGLTYILTSLLRQKWCNFGVLIVLCSGLYANAPKAQSIQFDENKLKQYQLIIEQMRLNSLGPFQQTNWLCNDNTVLTISDCDSGRLLQGAWSIEAQTLRDDGFYIANTLNNIDIQAVGLDRDPLGQLPFILLEQFLISIDSGWITRQVQLENNTLPTLIKKRQAQTLLNALLNRKNNDIEHTYLIAAESMRWLPLGVGDNAALNLIQHHAMRIKQVESSFDAIHRKMATRPDIGDIQRLRDYLVEYTDSKQKVALEQLLQMLEKHYEQTALYKSLDALEQSSGDDELATLSTLFRTDTTPAERFSSLTNLAAVIRRLFSSNKPMLQASLLALLIQIEEAALTDSEKMIQAGLDQYRRDELLQLLEQSSLLLFGTGLISTNELLAFQSQMQKLWSSPGYVTLGTYRQRLDYLARMPAWVEQRLALFFEPAINKMALIEPLSREFITARLQRSALVLYTAVLQELELDAVRLGGVQHQLFADKVDIGLQALNAGFSSGVLHTPATMARADDTENTILMVSEDFLASLIEMPHVKGIVMIGDANRLANIQLQARQSNLPSVVIADHYLKQLQVYMGEPISITASPSGIVSIQSRTNALARSFDSDFNAEFDAIATLESQPTLTKAVTDTLNLEVREPLLLSQLSRQDADVLVGRKLAETAELAKRFPEEVATAVALPFGVFHRLLDQPKTPEQSWLEWLKARYVTNRSLSPEARVIADNELAETLQNYWLNVELPDEFMARLQIIMSNQFGVDGSYGVEVHSDLNIGGLSSAAVAGLKNNIMENIVGEAEIMQAVRQAWANVYLQENLKWIQNDLVAPEQVYASVLLQKTVRADVSGLLITQDVLGNDPRQLFIFANQGSAGLIKQRTAETIGFHQIKDEVTLFNSATEPYQKILLKSGGSALAITDKSWLLSDIQIRTIRHFSNKVGRWFDDFDHPDNLPAAEVEFSFVGERFRLLQIQPYQSLIAPNSNPQITEFETQLEANQSRLVELYSALYE